MKGLVFDIKRYSIHDGPGLRTTVFFKGCPLKCLWCHNPESQKSTKEIMYHAEECIFCLTCKSVCTKSAIGVEKNHIKIDSKTCDLCGECTANCPTNALEMVGKFYEPEELKDEVLKDRDFFGNDGGITISGGEPLMQFDFLMRLLALLKKEQVNIALDTTGFTDTDKILSTLPYVDIYLYDIKHMDSKIHKKYTGVENDKILSNLIELDRNGARISIRFPLIPSINDDEENIKKTAQFVSKLNNIESVDILPYHSMMEDKYRKLEKPFLLKHIGKPTKKRIEYVKKQFEQFGLKVNIGG